jgi:hypothetical protein
MNTIYRSHHIAVIAILLSASSVIHAEPSEDKTDSLKPSESMTIAHGMNEDAKSYQKAEDTGYLQLDHKNLVETKELQILARKKPDSRIIRIVTDKAWEAFIKEFAGVETKTGKPLSLRPDFTQQLVLAFYVGPEMRGNSFSDIEIYAGKNTLNSFIFHGPEKGKDPVAISKGAKQTFLGTFYIAILPAKYKNHTLEFRMAYQSWGRECSRFSPPVTNRPTDKAD